MYILKCKILKLDSCVTFKRFYNPPTKKSWSKQNPLFRTPRPLVDPYNLGRLHPDKEWWNLPKKGLTPDTFMGFPDVCNITKHGGSLYTHYMDGPTLSMVVYRCIDKGITDVDIWNKLTLQSLRLAMSLDPYLVSILFLYFSLSSHYDHKFVSTFVGRILATLDRFTLEDCSNVILAMENPRFYHEGAFQYVMKHSENLSLNGELNVNESLGFLFSLKNVDRIPRSCLVSIGELIEVSDLTVLDKTLVFDAMDSCCRFKDIIDLLCVTKLFNQCCNILKDSTTCNHYFNLIFLNSIITFDFKDECLLDSIITRAMDNVFEATLEEQCRYIYLLGKLSTSCNKVMKLITVFEKQVCKRYEEVVSNDILWFYVTVGLLNSRIKFDQSSTKILEKLENKLKNLNRSQLFELYSSLSKARPTEGNLRDISTSVVNVCWNLDDLTLDQHSSLLDWDYHHLVDIVHKDRVNYSFNILCQQINELDSNQIISLIKFALNDRNYSRELIPKLKDLKRSLSNVSTIIEVIKLYKCCKMEVDKLVYELIEGVCRRKNVMLSEDKVRLMSVLEENKIKF